MAGVSSKLHWLVPKANRLHIFISTKLVSPCLQTEFAGNNLDVYEFYIPEYGNDLSMIIR